MADCGCDIEIQDRSQRQVLVILLLINGVMFLAEFGAGWFAESTGLIADSLDMLADAMVYAISFVAVGRSPGLKARSALLSGVFQVTLALGVAAEVVRRFVTGSDPVSTFMMVVGGIALLANLVCLMLLHKHRHGEVHMQASWIFSANDVLANLGVILAGGLVYLTASRYPDLVIGLIIALLVLRGGIRILQKALVASQSGCN